MPLSFNVARRERLCGLIDGTSRAWRRYAKMFEMRNRARACRPIVRSFRFLPFRDQKITGSLVIFVDVHFLRFNFPMFLSCRHGVSTVRSHMSDL